MPTHKNTFNYAASGRTINNSADYTGEAEFSLEVTIAFGEIDLFVEASIDVSETKSMSMSCDFDLTVKTNSSSDPDDTIELVANVPYVFNTDLVNYYANALTTDVTAFYLTNIYGEPEATFKLEVLTDPTP